MNAPEHRPGATSAVTVMTVNVGNGLASDDQILMALRHSGADIIGLQELNRRQARVVERELVHLYPHHAFFGDSYEGRGLLSRLPITSVELFTTIADRPDVLATIDLGAISLTVIVGHPRPQVMRRGRVMFPTDSLRQIVQLGRLAAESAPAILMGDFNMSPRHPGYARFQKLGLIDSYATAGSGRGWTFPIRLGLAGTGANPEHRRKLPMIPIKRFDHIWHTPDLTTEKAWIGPDAGSDHASVMARILVVTRQDAMGVNPGGVG